MYYGVKMCGTEYFWSKFLVAYKYVPICELIVRNDSILLGLSLFDKAGKLECSVVDSKLKGAKASLYNLKVTKQELTLTRKSAGGIICHAEKHKSGISPTDNVLWVWLDINLLDGKNFSCTPEVCAESKFKQKDKIIIGRDIAITVR